MSVKQAEQHLDTVVLPALSAVRDELAEQGLSVEIEEGTGTGRIGRTATLVVTGELTDFRYPVQLQQMPAPSYGARMIEADDTTASLEVALPTGGTYSVLDYDHDEVCHDVLDHYQRWSHSSVLTAETIG